MSSDKYRLDPLPQPPLNPNPEIPLAWRVEDSYRQLAAVASELNTVSDELGKSIEDLNAALRKLNLGVTAWVEVRAGDNPTPDDLSWWSEDLGYAKVENRWGVALRKAFGDYNYPEEEQSESWQFNDAPRLMRLAAIEKIPELLEKLSKEAVETTAKIKGKLAEAQEVAAVVKEAASGPKKSPFARPAQEQKK
jgi:hypothetical protein